MPCRLLRQGGGLALCPPGRGCGESAICGRTDGAGRLGAELVRVGGLGLQVVGRYLLPESRSAGSFRSILEPKYFFLRRAFKDKAGLLRALPKRPVPACCLLPT